MEWFYVSHSQQIGPVSQTEFERLVSGGTIGPETLVWRQGLPQWQAYAAVAGESTAGVPAAEVPPPVVASQVAPGSAVCSECGRVLPADDVIPIAGRRVCAACKPAFLQRVREGSVRAVQTYGGFWIRFVARIIDGIILWIVNTAIAVPVLASLALTGTVVTPTPEAPFAMLKAQLMLAFFQILVAASYETLFIGRLAATPGKMVCRLKVVRPDGGRVSYARALGRYGGTFISGIILCIGYIIAAFDDEKRALHDRICDTRVIRR